MIRAIKLKLDTTPAIHESLIKTMRDYAVAFNLCSLWGFNNHTFSKIACHNATYTGVRKSVPNLPSSLVQGARDVACECLKSVKFQSLPCFKDRSAMRYNQRVIRVCLESQYVTFATSNGRIKTTFVFPDYYRKYLTWQIKSSNITFNKFNKCFYLHCYVESPPPGFTSQQLVMGIDRGLVNIAVCSDNKFFNSSAVKNARAKFAHLRAELQSKGTRSAKRKLREISGRERRFVTNVNHYISKQIVQSHYTVFALENLSKIRVQKRRGSCFNRKLNNWAFYQLEQFIRYKAEALGKRVLLVDARFTSQKCSSCGHVYKGNRKGSEFLCRSCGFELHADLNASRNIAQDGISVLGRLLVNQPNVACL